MTGVVRPIGPEEPVVYWRRRLLVGLLAFLTLFALTQMFSGGDDGNPAAAAIPAGAASATPLAAASATPGASADSTGLTEPATPTVQTLQPTAQPTVQVVAEGECSDAQISMQVEIDRKTTDVGEGVHIKMILKNTSTTTCIRDVGSGANEITVISGPALIWSTDHCNASTEKDLQEFAPGQEWSVNVVWIGKQTAKGCKVRNMAQPGAYWAHGRNGSLNSNGMKFEVQ
ncbi:MAG: hypothetical protein NWS06_00380 [Candidatus Nanopelagicales bacterium]|nr:hypothetical protein [Candidatus Nanopelagicales bacterium]